MSNENKPDKKTLDAWHDDPNNWKWGIFYCNKSDKRIFPPKRAKALGWPVNFGNPVAYLIIVLILLAAIVPYLYMVMAGTKHL